MDRYWISRIIPSFGIETGPVSRISIQESVEGGLVVENGQPFFFPREIELSLNWYLCNMIRCLPIPRLFVATG